MKRIFSFFLPALLLLHFTTAAQQNRCGFDLVLQGMDAKSRATVEAQYAEQVRIANAAVLQEAFQNKTTGNAPVPVVFHYLITEREREILGGDTGIQGRVARQLDVLNDDFNALNADQVNIPQPFKARFGNAGIRFGLAGRTSAYTISKGIEVRELSSTAGYDLTTAFQDAKRFSEGGLDGWDYTKYLNVWVFNTGNQLLGLAIPTNFIGSTFDGAHIFSGADVGIVVNYRALGKRQSIFDSYISRNDLGRTLTHETGHFFNLRHIWGNTTGSCSIDDGIADTPPQFEATYCDATGCPVFPLHDACTPSGNGIMFMNYMDYSDDRALNMFTQNQASLMQSLVAPGGPLVSLTDNPALSVAGAPLAGSENLLQFFPNPATTEMVVQSPAGGKITAFTLTDVTGREVFRIAELSGTQNTIVLSSYARGLYFVRAHVSGQPFSGKIVLQ
jgi:hypothetical protein